MVLALLKKIEFSAPLRNVKNTNLTSSSLEQAPTLTTETATRKVSRVGWRFVLILLLLLVISALIVAIYQVSSPNSARYLAYWNALVAANNSVIKLAPLSNIAQATPRVSAPDIAASAPSQTSSTPLDLTQSLAQTETVKTNTPTELTKSATAENKLAISLAKSKESRSPENNLPTQQGQAWVKQMPPGTFLVQHVSLPTYEDAVQWLTRHPNLKKARTVITYLPNQSVPQYDVVSGPFASLLDASSFVDNGGIPKDPWIRSARFMKEQFTPELAAAYAQRRQEAKR
jgi:hypothetical protein